MRRDRLGIGSCLKQSGPFGVFRVILLDISANILCVAVLLLAILPPSAQTQFAPHATRAPLRTAIPQGAPEALDALYRRTARDPNTVAIDLGRRVVVKMIGQTPQDAILLDPERPGFERLFLQQIGSAPIDLFVFDHRWYEVVRGLLDARDAQTIEHDVPRALRVYQSDPDDRPEIAWARPFEALFGRRLIPDDFRARLQAMLKGGIEAAGLVEPQGNAHTPPNGWLLTRYTEIMISVFRLILFGLAIALVFRVSSQGHGGRGA